MDESRRIEFPAVAVPFDFQGRISSVTEHISESGLRCRTSRRLEEMTIVDMRFPLPGKNSRNTVPDWVECRGIVVRCEERRQDGGALPYEVVIVFDDISEEDRLLLSRL